MIAGMAVLALVACKKNVEPGKEPVDFSQYKVRVEPVITRVTETNFEAGDAIGLSVALAGGDYAANVQMKYDGTAFSGDLNWYEKGEETSTLKAYYPYKEGEGLPTMFSVQQDQSKGIAASDFVSAVKENVLPSANAVPVVFKHQLSRLVTTVKNNTGADIESIVFEEFVPQAHIAADLTAKVVDGAKWQPLTPFTPTAIRSTSADLPGISASVSSSIAGLTTSQATFRMNTATTSAPKASIHASDCAKYEIASARATGMELIASLRWCQALASKAEERNLRATARVHRKTTSLATREATAIQKANAAGADDSAPSAAASNCRTAARPIPMATAANASPIAAATTAWILPCPYGCSSSAGAVQ